MTIVIEGSVAVAVAVAGAYCRECSNQVGGIFAWFRGCGPYSCCCCGGGPRRRKLPWDPKSSGREDFEQLIGFLAAVPLCQKQLPRAELPKLAMALQRRTWLPGERVVAQGEEGREFFIIHTGEARVTVADVWGEETERAKLYHADYFGGHTLTTKRPNAATIYCKGPKPLETLSLTRAEFERLGLHKKLKFPQRPAIYEGRQIQDGQRMAPATSAPSAVSDSPKGAELSEEDIVFIMKAVQDNSNLRTRGVFDPSAVRAMAAVAKHKCVAQGAALLQGGELSHDFFVLARGAFDLIPATSNGGHRSVEARLASKTIHDRLARKQEFLMGVVRHDASRSLPKKGAGRQQLGNQDSDSTPSMKFRKRAQSTILIASPVEGFHDDGSKATASSKSKKNKPRHTSMRMAFGGDDVANRFLDIDSPFQVGDLVARVVAAGGGDEGGSAALVREVGKVLEITFPGEEGEVVVEFPGTTTTISVLCLRPTEEKGPIAEVKPGECMGELALLYNTRQMAMYRAKQDSEVFVIDHRAFKECFSRETAQLKGFITLLDQVHMLTPLLRSERAELARNSRGLLSFRPREVVLCRGEVPDEQFWYVVASGGGTMEEADGTTTDLHPAGHFGEQEVLRTSTTSEVSVTAGPHGMSCVVFDGEVMRNLKSLEIDDKGNVCDYEPNLPYRRTFSLVPLDHLSIVAILGEGGFGSVFLARHNTQDYALKRLSKGYIAEQNMIAQICAERDILSMIDSPFIIRFFRSYRDVQYLYMLIEYATGGQLYTIMTDRAHILEQDEPRGSSSMFYIACVIYALEHLHERNIVYRDLKPENILLDGNGYAKICDLGFARFVLGKTNTMVGTPEYMAPEMIDSPHAHDIRVDWWALGVLAFELLAGQVPFDSPDDDDDDVMIKLLTIRKNQDLGMPVKLMPGGMILAKDFVKALLTVNEEQRLGRKGGDEVRKHPWFTYFGFDFKALVEQRMPAPYASQKKVVERVLSSTGTVKNLDSLHSSDCLFASHIDDKSGWDEAF
mmetsp:Transcript_48424/g.156202  ORF Transcript_48424/g.156202 Transcript_48424/m.156202 type:complete len:1017 (+) Transcript_48424:968-4018(+)